MAEINDTASIDLGSVKTFLKETFRAHLSGQSTQYNMIVKQLRLKDDSDTLVQVLLALKSFIHMMTLNPDKFKDLFGALFHFDFECDVKVAKAFLDLTIQLVSANVLYLSSILELFAHTFRNISRILSSEKAKVSSEFVDALHATVQKLLSMVPTATSVFLPILYRLLPHKRFEKQMLVDYVSQLLRVLDYSHLCQHRILEMIVERCLELDVDIVIEDSGEVRLQRDDERDEEIFDDIFTLEQHHVEGVSKTRMMPLEVAELADKLDALLLLFLSFLDSHLSKKDLEATRRMQGCLLDIFERRLLSAHKSKFVQFVVFYFASKHAPFCYDFANRLLQKTLDAREASIIRQSAVMYLASFLSRAQYAPLALVSDLIRKLLLWSVRYIVQHQAHTMALSDQLSRSTEPFSIFFPSAVSNVRIEDLSAASKLYRIPSHIFVNRVEFDEFGRLVVQEHTAQQHEVFYAAVQSICYVLCFYGTVILHGEAGLMREALWKEAWEIVISSRFDPMRYCLRTVRLEFLKLAHHVCLLSESIWEGISPDLLLLNDHDQLLHDDENGSVSTPVFIHTNAMVSNDLATTTTLALGQHSRSTAVLGPNTLESFFPFDPCLLQRMHSIIEAHYRPWKGVPGLSESGDFHKRGGGDRDELADDEGQDNKYSAEDIMMAQSLASSMVSSLACTDDGHLREACSMASMSISMTTSYIQQELVQRHNAMLPPSSLPTTKATPSHASPQYPQKQIGAKALQDDIFDSDGEPDADDGLEHIPNPDLNHHALQQLQGTHQTPNGSHLRRPRLYSIGSNGSW